MNSQQWHKSTHSAPDSHCVEVADLTGGAGVRDSKLQDRSPVLAFPAAQFAAFIGGIKADQLG